MLMENFYENSRGILCSAGVEEVSTADVLELPSWIEFSSVVWDRFFDDSGELFVFYTNGSYLYLLGSKEELAYTYERFEELGVKCTHLT